MHIFYCGCLIHTFSMEEFFFLVKNLKGACIYTSRTHLKIIISLFWVVKPFFEILFLFLKKEFFVPAAFFFHFFQKKMFQFSHFSELFLFSKTLLQLTFIPVWLQRQFPNLLKYLRYVPYPQKVGWCLDGFPVPAVLLHLTGNGSWMLDGSLRISHLLH